MLYCVHGAAAVHKICKECCSIFTKWKMRNKWKETIVEGTLQHMVMEDNIPAALWFDSPTLLIERKCLTMFPLQEQF